MCTPCIHVRRTLAQALTQLYGTPDNCDAYVCGLAERKLPDSHFGPLFNASLTDQYLRVRDGDWWVGARLGGGPVDGVRAHTCRCVWDCTTATAVPTHP
jgi:hypothetical protein